MSILRRALHLLAPIVTVLVATAPSPALPAAATRQQRPALSGRAPQVFLPVVARPNEPIGIITTPAELLATKMLADQGIEPSYKAVRKLLDDAGDGMLFAPCALASYTTELGKQCLNESARYTYALALAYRLTYDPRYAYQSAAIIRAWYTTLAVIDPQPPNDTDQPWLDWSRWAPAMIWGADLLEGAPGWTAADRQQFATMLVGKVLIMGQKASGRTNNWADAGNVLRLTIAIYADLPAERDAAIASWKQLLDYGMAADGSLPEENRRAQAGLAYNQGAMSFKTVFAEIVRRRGDVSLYSYTTPRGVGLKNGWDFLAPQVVSAYNHENNQGPCEWPYTADHCVDYSNKTGWEIAFARWRTQAYLGPIDLERSYGWSDASDPGYSTLLFANLSLGQQ